LLRDAAPTKLAGELVSGRSGRALAAARQARPEVDGDPGCAKLWLPSLADAGGGREPANLA
jgi:hypothetical protein